MAPRGHHRLIRGCPAARGRDAPWQSGNLAWNPLEGTDPMTNPATKTVATQDLKLGDVVQFYGSRLLLTKLNYDGAAMLETARKFVGADHEISRIGEAEWAKRQSTLRNFTGQNLGPVGDAAHQSFTSDWNVQGNCYAAWTVEVPQATTA